MYRERNQQISFPREKSVHNVVELDLLVETDSGDDFIFEFPQCIFSCKTLVALKVYSNCISYSPPTSGCVLNLKTLYVGLGAEYPDRWKRFFLAALYLEDLTIMGLLGEYEVLNYKISAPALNTLRLNYLYMLEIMIRTTVFLLIVRSLKTLISGRIFCRVIYL